MSWKEFLKLDWKKVLIFSALILISFTVGTKIKSETPEPGTFGLPYTKIYFNPILWLPYTIGSALRFLNINIVFSWGKPSLGYCGGYLSFLSELFCFISFSSEITVFDIFYKTPHLLFSTLIYWYFLSCLVIWIYDKLTRKRRIEV